MISRILADTKIVKLFSPSQRLPFVEFIALMALTTSLVALTIDGMLPALPAIGQDLALADPNHTQLIVSMVFLGMAFGQLLFGPMSDSYGRKVALYAGMSVFMLGCLLSIFATDFNTMLIGRVLQGIGASAPRVVPMALIRDEYEGREMARIMSLIMMVFILVPMLAPMFGQLVVYLTDWRGIFYSFLLIAMVLSVWFAMRQPETLVPEKRKPFTGAVIIHGIVEVFKNRKAFGYTLAVGVVSGPFLAYLSTAQPILEEQYALGPTFTLYFAVLALSIGVASVVNSRVVVKYGMRFLSYYALAVIIIASALFALLMFFLDGEPSVMFFMGYLIVTLFCMGIVFGNMNALAMEPLGHIAGIGAAVVGSLSTFISVPIGIAIGQAYDQSVMPLVLGFLTFALIASALMVWAEKGAVDSVE
jgi:DHA1 family bicyclomycin/chloramphenicol resistance-like MFS transporter